MKVGYIVFPPSITKEASSEKLGGHLVKTIQEIVRVNNWNVEFVETDWANFTAGLKSQRYDVSIAPTFITPPRAASASFTRPLFFLGNSAIAVINDNRFDTLDSIDQPGIRVAVTQGEAGDEYARANFRKAEVSSFSGNQSLAFQAVISGQADIALGDAFATSQFVRANSDRVKDLFADNPYNLTPISWAVRHGDYELLEFLNDSLESLDYQGKLIEWEQEAGANWLHLDRSLQFTNQIAEKR